MLGAWNICSKEWVIRQYDHEVQGASVLKPLVGNDNDGPGDAAIIKPLADSNKGVIVSNGINPATATSILTGWPPRLSMKLCGRLSPSAAA